MKRIRFLLCGFILSALVLSLSGCGQGAAPEAAITFTTEDASRPFRDEVLPISLPEGVSLPQSGFSVWDGKVVFYDHKQWLYALEPASGSLEQLLYIDAGAAGFARDSAGRIWVLYDSLTGETSSLKCFEGAKELGTFSCADFGEDSAASADSVFFDGYYLYLYNYFGDKLLALDISGDTPKPAFTLDSSMPKVSGVVTTVLTNGAGTLLFAHPDAEGYTIQACDPQAKRWKVVERLEGTGAGAQMSAASGNRFCLDDGRDLYVYDLDAGTRTLCFNWTVSGISPDSSLYALEDGTFLMQYFGQLLRLAPGEKGTADVQVLTLATLGCDGLLDWAVADFNSKNESVKIEIVDYAQYNSGDDNSAGLLRLSTDLIAGNTPDLFDLSALPGSQYAARGLLEDLYPYIDSDPELSRERFIPNILSALETDGKLYALMPGFGVMTFVGNKDMLGGRDSWNFDEFYQVIDALPEDVAVLDEWTTQSLFLEYALTFNADAYMDWESASCSFDSPDFIRLLEFAGTFPESTEAEPYADMGAAMMEGRQLLTVRYPTYIPFVDTLSRLTGGDPAFIGFPSQQGGGNAAVPYLELGICTKSEHKDACWAFIRHLLTPEVQDDLGCFPIDNGAFQRMKEDYVADMMDVIPSEAQARAELAQQLVASVDRIKRQDPKVMEIVFEEAGAFFAGDKSAAECARIIQSRTSTYIAEQS